MTIASEIQRIQGNIADAYNSCAAKGATMPATNNSASLANTIDTISAGGGGGELGSLGIGKYYVNNGVAQPQACDVSNAFQGIVSIQANAMNAACLNMNITGMANFCNLTDIADNGMSLTFQACKYLTGANFVSLMNIANNGMYCAFNGCSNLSGDLSFGMHSIENSSTMYHAFAVTNIGNVSFPNLQYINSYNALRLAFSGATYGSNIISLSMPYLVHANYGAMENICAHCYKLTSINFENLQTVNYGGLKSAFNSCNSLTEAHFNSLTKLDSSADLFRNCYNLTTVSFPSYVNANGDDFSGSFRWCYNLVNVNFDNFANMRWSGAFNYAFQYCNHLETIKFPSLNYMNGGCFVEAFSYCTNLKDIYFNALTPTSFVYQNQFRNMLRYTTGVNVHFPAAIQETIGTWSDVTSGFGGTSTTVLFDL